MIYVIIASTQIHQRRLAHTDIHWPDFTEYRKEEVKDPSAKSRDTASSRKSISYVVAAGKYISSVRYNLFKPQAII